MTVRRLRLAAGWLGCGLFELIGRLERGETHWVSWALAARNAEIDAWGVAEPAGTVGALALAPRREE